MVDTIEIDVTMDDICEAILTLEEAKYVANTNVPTSLDGYFRSHNCPIAKAARRMGYDGAWFAGGELAYDGNMYRGGEDSNLIARLFDSRQYYCLEPKKIVLRLN